MESIVQVLYDSIYPHLDANPHLRAAERQWDALSKTLNPEIAEAVSLLTYEWGFSCFSAGLHFQRKLTQELAAD